MALLKYFKIKIRGLLLPNPSGSLNQQLSSTAIEEADKEVTAVLCADSAKHQKISPEQKAIIEQSVERTKHLNIAWHVAYDVATSFNGYCITIPRIFIFSLTVKLLANYRCPVPLLYMVTANRAVGFEFFSHDSWAACVKAF